MRKQTVKKLTEYNKTELMRGFSFRQIKKLYVRGELKSKKGEIVEVGTQKVNIKPTRIRKKVVSKKIKRVPETSIVEILEKREPKTFWKPIKSNGWLYKRNNPDQE